ncbi:type IV toxin-antitoxin system AbiEi family antitoxin domain-containing protein [Glycomyces rhizosphaerae]|uniref:Type IV toxin-antitoxin system AbiEi family antitoxin domain-containing protein n=1 Tax=Glycomyces rhizosphaerae TaxID=2054422 RepID=A0ABV7Q3R4_9ACTN
MGGMPLPLIFQRSDLARLGLTPHRLYAMAKAGELEQFAPGVYVRAGAMDDTAATWASIAIRNPSATICLTSALSMHDLTDEIPAATDIALPRGDRTLTTRFAPIHWHSFDKATFTIGRAAHAITEDIEIGLYSPERTLIDVYRLRHDIGADVAHEALKRWLRRRGSTPSELMAMARSFPKAEPSLRTALEILL